MISILAPSFCQKALSRSTSPSAASSGGVRMHQRSWNRVAKPASGPLRSVPATGWAGMIRAPGKASASAVCTLSLDDPTSLITASAGRSSAISAATSAITPTGTHRITRSASVTAAPALSLTSSQKPSSSTRARTAGSLSCPVIRAEGMVWRAAWAIEEPISPSPIIVILANGSISRRLPLCLAAPRRRPGSPPRCRW